MSPGRKRARKRSPDRAYDYRTPASPPPNAPRGPARERWSSRSPASMAPMADMTSPSELPGWTQIPTRETYDHLMNQIQGVLRQQYGITQDYEVDKSDREILTKKVESFDNSISSCESRIGILERGFDDQKVQFGNSSQRVDKVSQQVDNASQKVDDLGQHVHQSIPEMRSQNKDMSDNLSRQAHEQTELTARVKRLEAALSMSNHRQQILAQANSMINTAFSLPCSTSITSVISDAEKPEIQDETILSLPSTTSCSPLLKLLRRMDFRDAKHLKALRNIEDIPFVLPMFHENEKSGNENIAYTVHGREPLASCLIACDRKVPTKPSGFRTSTGWEDLPRIIEVHDHRKACVMGYPVLPKYLWEIGEIYVRRKSSEKGNQRIDKSSCYHLVVDITTPAKSIWMIYRYVEHDGDSGIERGVSRPKTLFWHPFGQINNECFDAAQVFTDIKDWQGSETPVGQFRNAALTVKTTGRNTQPVITFVEPIWAEVKIGIEQGWQMGHSGHSSD